MRILALIATLIAVVLIVGAYQLSRYLWTTPLPPRRAMAYAYMGGAMDIVAIQVIGIAAYLWLS